MRILTLLLFSYLLLNAQNLQTDASYFDNHLQEAIKTIATKDEQIGLDKISLLIKKDPKKFNDSYHKLFRDPYKSKYTEIIKKYTRFIDIMIFNETVRKKAKLSSFVQNSAITYVFFSSKIEFMEELLKFNEAFEELIYSSTQNLTKTNKELLALFQANYFLGINQDAKAYKILKQNQPYHSKALQTLSYFSNIKNIPIYKNRDLLLKAINFEKLKLKDAIFEYKPDFLFDTEGRKIKINYLSNSDFDMIMNTIKNKVQRSMFAKPKKNFIISPLFLKYKNNFVFIQTVAMYDDSSYIETDYVADEVLSLCFEKKGKKWEIIYELTRTDVPSKEQLKEIQKTFPAQFPKELLSKFWRKLF